MAYNDTISSPTEISAQKELTEEEEIYKENIIDYYKNPKNKEELKDATVSTKGSNPLCGDKITLHLKIEENNKDKTIKKATFQGTGCAISQASISMLTEKIENKTTTKAKQLTKDDIYEMLGIPISHTRSKCALLSLKTLKKALE